MGGVVEESFLGVLHLKRALTVGGGHLRLQGPLSFGRDCPCSMPISLKTKATF